MAPQLDAAAIQRSLLVYLVGRSAALPLFLFFGYQAMGQQETPLPGIVAMVNGVVGLGLVLWAYRRVGIGGTPHPESLLWGLAGLDALTLVVLWIYPTVALGMVMGLLLFFLIIGLFSGWTVRRAREITTGRH